VTKRKAPGKKRSVPVRCEGCKVRDENAKMRRATNVVGETVGRALDDITDDCPKVRFYWEPEWCDLACGTATAGDKLNPAWKCWEMWLAHEMGEGRYHPKNIKKGMQDAQG